MVEDYGMCLDVAHSPMEEGFSILYMPWLFVPLPCIGVHDLSKQIEYPVPMYRRLLRAGDGKLLVVTNHPTISSFTPCDMMFVVDCRG